MHIVLAEVNAVGACGQRDINTVVDQERHAASFKRCLQGAGQFHKAAALALLVPVLDEGRAARNSLPDKLDRIPAAGPFRIDDAVEAEIDWVYETLPQVTRVSGSR
jgi:hypothetical protein